MATRRCVLKAGVLAGSLAGSFATAARAAAATPAASAALTPFTLPMPVPPVLKPSSSTADTDFYRLVVGESTAEILPGVETDVLTYNGSFPGPTLRARAGRRTVVTATNLLSRGVSLHLHGGQASPADDGGPMELIQPGTRRRYTYDNRQVAAPLWYHDHAHMDEAEHVYRGLAGFYLLTDDHEEELNLPRGKYDVPIALRDARFDADGQLVYVPDDFEGRTTSLANGRPQPYFNVAARKYRFRILNASNLRFYTLSLSSGDDLIQIASDRGLLPAPAPARSITLSPGERADVVVDFGRHPVGTRIVLRHRASRGAPPENLVAFDVTAKARDRSTVPDELAELPALPTPTVHRDIVLERAGRTWLINGKAFDPARVDTAVAWGTTEVWTVVNRNRVPHNLHLHLVQFRILDRDGRPPAAGEAGLKDTVRVMPGEAVRIQTTFDTWTGRYVYHCHMLDHSAMGMMATMEITD
ncbi:multicopper oxidase family protein [Yinghuangia sp. YIM S10712]|uniref:multicopper oxidase family protein n=1 Tax=Yinghuangia sp. YIM S10712 TaxID=3436930 RepID=UPI003F5321CF